MREKVLYLPGFSPFQTNGGGNQRCNAILKALSLRYDVDVVVDFDRVEYPIVGESWGGVKLVDIQQNSYCNFLERLSRKLTLKFNATSPQMLMPTNIWKYRNLHEHIKRNDYKWIIVRYLFMIPYYKLYKFPNLIIDIDDIPYKKLESSLKFKHIDLSSDDLKEVRRLRHVS